MPMQNKTQEERIQEAKEELFKLNSRGCGAFDPSLFTVTLEDDKRYLEVKYRIAWFRLVYPKGIIKTQVTAVTEQGVLCEASIYETVDQLLSTAIAFRPFGQEYSPYETSETAAVGRALSFAGFGTVFCAGDLYENPMNLCDSPEKGLQKKPEPNTAKNSDQTEAKKQEKIPQKTQKKQRAAQTLEDWGKQLPEGFLKVYKEAYENMTYEEASLCKCPAGKNKEKTLDLLVREPDAKEIIDGVLKYQYVPTSEEEVFFFVACKKFYKKFIAAAQKYQSAFANKNLSTKAS